MPSSSKCIRKSPCRGTQLKLVAIARVPAHSDKAAKALAGAASITLAEARMRLAREPPMLVARLEPDHADALAAALCRAGLAALAVAARCPSDRDRTVARSFALADEGVTFTPRFGEPVELAWAEVLAVLRGARASRSEIERSEKSKRFSVGAAIATSGLKVTRSSTRMVRSSEETTEQVILVYARDGRAVMLTEGELDFSCLGAAMQTSSTANMVELAGQLRGRATGALHDDRLVRLGRRPLPFLASGESRSQTAATVLTRTDTTGSLDVLAEVIRQALTQGLLP